MDQNGSLENGAAAEDGSPNAGKNPEAEPLNVRILHSLEETINHSVQAVKDAVIGAEVDDFEKPQGPKSNAAAERDEEGSSKSLLQSVEDTFVQSVHSVEEKFAHSVQTVKDAVNAAAEAAAAPASSTSRGSPGDEQKNKGDVTVEDEAAILVHSVIQD